MEEINRQVRRARRRLLLNNLAENLTWVLLAAAVIALVGISIPKFWPLGIDKHSWLLACTVGPLAAGLLLSFTWTYLRRGGDLDAALEIDQRYGLKERVSSVVALSEDERKSAAGMALLDDAEHRIRRIDVREHFQPNWGWRPLIPALVAGLAFVVAVFLEDATRDASAMSSPKQHAEQVKTSAEHLRKQVEKKKREAEQKGLKDAAALFTEMQRVADDLARNEIDRKKAIVKLNNLAKHLNSQRDGLAGTQRMRKQLEQLKNIQRGPADRIATALKDGDLSKAIDAMKQLEEQLRSDKLTEEQKKALGQQLNQLREQVQKMLAAKNDLEQQKRDLQKRMDDLKQQGDLASAGKLQNKLDQVQESLDALDKQRPQLQRLQQLSDQLGASAESLQKGDAGKAAEQMAQMADMLNELKEGMDKLETLDALMDQIADAKNAMNCQECGGEGCESCMGNAMAMQGSGSVQGPPASGMSEGTGTGDRPEEQDETGGYRSRVGGKPQPGEAVRVGDAMGPNIAGGSQQEVKQEISSAFREDADPLFNRNLPRREREQAKAYFENYRKGRATDGER